MSLRYVLARPFRRKAAAISPYPFAIYRHAEIAEPAPSAKEGSPRLLRTSRNDPPGHEESPDASGLSSKQSLL